MTIETIVNQASSNVVEAATGADTNFSNTTHAPATALSKIDGSIRQLQSNLRAVIGYVKSNSQTEEGQRLGYWLQQVGPAVVSTMNHVQQTVEAYLNQNLVLRTLSNVLEQEELTSNPEMARFAASNWRGLIGDGTLEKVQNKIGEIQPYTLADMADLVGDEQRTSSYFSEFRICTGRGVHSHKPHGHTPSEWVEYKGLKNPQIEKDNVLAPLRDALYTSSPQGGLQLAGYNSLECANEQIRGTGQSGPAAIAPLVLVDKAFIQGMFFNELSNQIHDKNMKEKLGQCAEYMNQMGAYMSQTLAGLKPVTNKHQF